MVVDDEGLLVVAGVGVAALAAYRGLDVSGSLTVGEARPDGVGRAVSVHPPRAAGLAAVPLAGGPQRAGALLELGGEAAGRRSEDHCNTTLGTEHSNHFRQSHLIDPNLSPAPN